MKRVAMFVFNGDPVCFIHVLLNAMDMREKGYDARIVMEGSSTKLIPELAEEKNPLHVLWEKAKGKDLVAGICRACSHKMGTLESAKSQGLAILEDMAGHPSMAGYRDQGFEIITF